MASTYTDQLTGVSTSVAVKAPVKAVATSPITLSGAQTVGGVAVTTGDRVLVTAQASSVDNGIYVAATTSWARAADFNGAGDVVKGTLIPVNTGNALYYKVTTADPVTIGSSAITFDAVTDLSTDTVYNVVTYGADPTGSAYSTTAIQAAIDAAFADTFGGTVYFPAGQYRIDAELVLPKSYTKAIRLVGEGPRTSQIYSVSNITAGSPLMRWDTSVAGSVQLYTIENLGLVRLNGGPLLQFRQNASATGSAGDRIAFVMRGVLLRQSTTAGQGANLDIEYSLKSYIERVWFEGGHPSGIAVQWANSSQDYFCELYNNGKSTVGDFIYINGGGDHTLVAVRGEGCAGNYFYKLKDCDHVTFVSPWMESDQAADCFLLDGARYCAIYNVSLGNQTGATNPNGIRFASTTRAAVGNVIIGGKSASFDTLGTGATVVFDASASSNIVQNVVIEGVASVSGEASIAGTDNFCTLIAGGGTPPTVQTFTSAEMRASGVLSRGVSPKFGSADNFSVDLIQNGNTIASVESDGINLASGKTLQVAGTQVVGARVTGWAAATGTPTRTSFATGSVTTAQLAERVKALIDDLISHGVIGA